MKIAFSLQLPREEASVPLVRRICGDALDCLGVERACVEDIELALTEACTNVLKHAVAPPSAYDVVVEINERKCEIKVIDAGAGFDSSSSGGGFHTSGDPAEGGRGILIMQSVVDDLKFTSEESVGSVVHLSKRLQFNDESLLKDLALQSRSNG